MRSQREELERQIRADLLPLSTVEVLGPERSSPGTTVPVSYTHLRAHETVLDLVCSLLLEKKKHTTPTQTTQIIIT